KRAGRYGTGDDAMDVSYLDGRLSIVRATGGEQQELRKLGDDLITDGVMGYGVKVARVEDGIELQSKSLKRVESPKPGEIPASWQGLLGEYGWGHDVLYVFEKDGQLNLLSEWMEYHALKQVSEDVFAVP